MNDKPPSDGTKDKPASKRILDLDLFRLFAKDCAHVYDAVNQAQALADEGARIVEQADRLLRQAGMSLLMEGVKPGVSDMDAKLSTAERMVTAYIELEHEYAKLKRILYGTAQSLVRKNAAGDAYTLLNALATIDPTYPGVEELQRYAIGNQILRRLSQKRIALKCTTNAQALALATFLSAELSTFNAGQIAILRVDSAAQYGEVTPRMGLHFLMQNKGSFRNQYYAAVAAFLKTLEIS